MPHEAPKKPAFLREQATKSKGPQGMQSQSGIAMVMKAIQQAATFFLAAKPKQTRKARLGSGSPLSSGPLTPRAGPTPPSGAVRHIPDDEEDDGDER